MDKFDDLDLNDLDFDDNGHMDDAIGVFNTVQEIVQETPIIDIHTHLFSPNFGDLLLWGIDELLTYHYLVAETMRWVDIPYDTFWTMSKHEQADLVWQTLFVDHSPISEACRGVLTVLDTLGLDLTTRDLDYYRGFFQEQTVEDYVDTVFAAANVDAVVMTNDPFDAEEHAVWMGAGAGDPRFLAALRIDGLLNSWDTAVPRLREWGYTVSEDLSGDTCAEVRRFLVDWAGRIDPVYTAVSLPPTFAFPEDSPRGRLIADCVLPVCAETGMPFAMMIGVKKLVNPELRLAGDSVGKSSIEVVEHLCRHYPGNKFLVTMLSRENQHELCVAARKFRNLHVFGCWWFLNNPSLIDEITTMRLELLGLSMTPQHSDARVLDQVVYKWTHSRVVIAAALAEKYLELISTGWTLTDDEISRDVEGLFGGNFRRFVGR